VVQSTDKNFMVPVGGAIVWSPNKKFIDNLSSTYPGRANINPILDLFITLLSMGEVGYRNLLESRENLYKQFMQKLSDIILLYPKIKILEPSKNYISIGISLPDIISDDIININNDNHDYHDNYDNDNHNNNDLSFNSNLKITPVHNDELITKLSADYITTTKSPTRTSPSSSSSSSSSTSTRTKGEGGIGGIDGIRNAGGGGRVRGGSQVMMGSNTFFGSMLFRRNVSGCRVVDNTSSSAAAASSSTSSSSSSASLSASASSSLSASASSNNHPNKQQHQQQLDEEQEEEGDGNANNRNFKKITNISGYKFQNWGSHCNNYPYSYFTIACSIGITEKDINLFIDRLQKCLYKYYHKDIKDDKNDINKDIIYEKNDDKNNNN
jgi:hypothetical protein